jgi:hypothetical protein
MKKEFLEMGQAREIAIKFIFANLQSQDRPNNQGEEATLKNSIKRVWSKTHQSIDDNTVFDLTKIEDKIMQVATKFCDTMSEEEDMELAQELKKFMSSK